MSEGVTVLLCVCEQWWQWQMDADHGWKITETALF